MGRNSGAKHTARYLSHLEHLGTNAIFFKTLKRPLIFTELFQQVGAGSSFSNDKNTRHDLHGDATSTSYHVVLKRVEKCSPLFPVESSVRTTINHFTGVIFVPRNSRASILNVRIVLHTAPLKTRRRLRSVLQIAGCGPPPAFVAFPVSRPGCRKRKLTLN